MVVLWRRAESDPMRRVGFTVSRQVRGAVARNRVKRRLREAYRATRDARPPGISLVVVGRPGVLNQPMAAVTGDMRQAFRNMPEERRAP